MRKVLVVAPHPDDETLGCGGTLLRHRNQGDELYWLIATSMTEAAGYTDAKRTSRQAEIERVAEAYGFRGFYQSPYPTARLDTIPRADLVGSFCEFVGQVSPELMYLPFPGDAHSDHLVVFEALTAATKSFRYPSVRRTLCYETPSETEFGVNPRGSLFTPQSFVDISANLEEKLYIFSLYAGETGTFPFPRSFEAIVSLAKWRGSTIACQAAEAFMVVKDIWK